MASSGGGGGFVDDTEDAIYTVQPSENVYSYFMFIGPTEAKKEGGAATLDTIMAWLLVGLNFFMQLVLLQTIYNEVVVANLDWQGGIMRVGKTDWDLFAPPPEKCNSGGSLCVLDGGSFTCAPPSVQLTGRWDELDTDGDGIWTRDEVVKARSALKCKYVVDPVEVFDVFQKFLLAREKIIWIHPDLRNGTAIHKSYFTYAAGDIIMCGYRNQNFCPNVLKRGFFDGPLKHHTAPRVGTTIDSAIDYCYDLLRPGGTCERTLPSTYSVWKIESAQQCQDASYSKFTYTNPGSGVTKSLLEVDYSAREDYEVAQTTTFKVFKMVIISMWLIQMLVELKDIIVVGTWVIRFPNAAQFGSEAVVAEVDPSDPENVKYKIQGITGNHRFMVGCLTLARLFLLFLLCYIGCIFLLKQTGYIDLLLDGVALVFILEIAGFLYGQLLRTAIREQTENLEPMHVPMYGIEFLTRRPALRDILSMVLIFFGVMLIMHIYYTNVVGNLYDALECTCLGKGDRCFEAQRFNNEFWDKYWTKEVPAVFAQLDELKAGVEATPASPSPAPAAVAKAAENVTAATAKAGFFVAQATASNLLRPAAVQSHRKVQEGLRRLMRRNPQQHHHHHVEVSVTREDAKADPPQAADVSPQPQQRHHHHAEVSITREDAGDADVDARTVMRRLRRTRAEKEEVRDTEEEDSEEQEEDDADDDDDDDDIKDEKDDKDGEDDDEDAPAQD